MTVTDETRVPEGAPQYPSADGLPTIWLAFAAAKAEVAPVGKDSRNTQQNFNFRGIDAVVNAAAAALNKHGIINIPKLLEVTYGTEEVGQKRTLMANVRVKVRYRFTGPRGDHFDVVVPGEAMDSGDKGVAKAMSVAWRIALIQALNLPTGDPDPDQNSYERSPRRQHSAGEAFDDAALPDSRRQAPRPPVQVPPLDIDDPWHDAIEGIDGKEMAGKLWGEVGQLLAEQKIDKARADRLGAVIAAKVTNLGLAARQVAPAAQAPAQDAPADGQGQTMRATPENDPWYTAPPAEPSPAPSPDGAWLIEALGRAAGFPAEAEGRRLWNENAARHRAGEIDAAGRKRIEMLIQARIDDLRAAPAEAEPVEGVVVSGLEPGDPWADKVADILSSEDAEAALADLEVSRKGGMDGRHYATVKAAIRAKAATLPVGAPA